MGESGQTGAGTAQRLQRLARAARRAQDATRDAEAARDSAIAEAEAGGYSFGEIAKLCELSKAHVHRIVICQASKQSTQQPDTD